MKLFTCLRTEKPPLLKLPCFYVCCSGNESSILEDKELIDGLKNGALSAYETLLKRSGAHVFNTALGILQNREDAEDITQEVFAEVYQAIQHFKEDSRLTTWIYRITVTKSLEHLRKQKTQKRFGFVIGIFGKEESIKKSDSTAFFHPGVQLENKERSAILFKALDQLPENQRAAFVLHKMEDLSYAEIAEVLKITVSSVESLMFRAKQNLRKLLAEYYEQNER